MVSTLRELNVRGPVIQRRRPQTKVRGIAADPALPRRRRLAVASLAFAFVHFRFHVLADHATIGDALPAGGSLLSSLWGPVLIAMLVAAGYQLADARRGTAYDCVARHVIAVGLLASLVLVSFELSLALALPFVLALAGIAADAYRRIYREIVAQRASARLGAPFALLAGYTAMLALATLDAAITWTGCPSSAPTISMIIAAGAMASHLALRNRDAVMPLLVAWMLVGLVAARPPTAIEHAALLMTAICAIVGIVTAATILGARAAAAKQPDRRTRVTPSRQTAWPSPSPRSHRA
jgi:hypothetical protein